MFNNTTIFIATDSVLYTIKIIAKIKFHYIG